MVILADQGESHLVEEQIQYVARAGIEPTILGLPGPGSELIIQ